VPANSDAPLNDSLTVIRTFLDGDLSQARIAALTPDERRELRGLVVETYREWVAPAPAEHEFRAFVATSPGRFISGRPEAEDGAALAAALLYAHRVAVPDPLERVVEPTVEQIQSVAAVAPLVDVGALILVPRRHVLSGFMWGHPADNTFSSITGPLSRDPRFRALAAEFPGSNLEEGRIGLAADDYTEELMIAGVTDSRFVPSTLVKRKQYAAFLDLAREELSRADVSLTALTALTETLLPLAQMLTIKELAAIRRDDETFAEWRAALHSASRTISAGFASQEFAAEATAVLEETVLVEAERVRRVTSRSRALKESVRQKSLQLTLGAALVAGAGTALGAPPLTALAGMSIGALSRLALRTLSWRASI
jgi:hypothetical protein